MVFDELQVKLTDTAAGRDLYSADYYQLDDHTRLPIRWIAWEALFMVSTEHGLSLSQTTRACPSAGSPGSLCS